MVTPQFTILYDASRIQQFGGFGSALFRFVTAHEYAHLINQHVPRSPQEYYDNELEADCSAAELYGWDSAEICAAVPPYRRQLPLHDMPGMPGYRRRADNLKRCG